MKDEKKRIRKIKEEYRAKLIRSIKIPFGVKFLSFFKPEIKKQFIQECEKKVDEMVNRAFKKVSHDVKYGRL